MLEGPFVSSKGKMKNAKKKKSTRIMKSNTKSKHKVRSLELSDDVPNQRDTKDSKKGETPVFNPEKAEIYKIFPCTICTHKASSSRTLTLHLKNIHSKGGKKCSKCDGKNSSRIHFQISGKDYLIQH